MEEKERYEMNDNDCLVDNEQNTTICDFCELTLFPEIVINLLNEQDKRIKELEEMNEKLDKRGSKNFDAYMRCSTKYTKSLNENQQLKQSQKQLAVEELKMFEAMLARLVLWDNDIEEWTIGEEQYDSFIEQIDDKIKELKGEE